MAKTWDQLYLDMAFLVASKSKDNSKKCGTVFIRTSDNSVLSTGYNGLPRGVEYTDDRQQRPAKYWVFEHAERNAVYNAVRNGVPLLDSTCYITGLPCADCARAIIQVGTSRVVVPVSSDNIFINPDPTRTWIDGVKTGLEMFKEAGVVLDYCDRAKE